MSTVERLEAEVLRLRADVNSLRHVLGTALSWMVQSANSPLRLDEVEKLLKHLESQS